MIITQTTYRFNRKGEIIDVHFFPSKGWRIDVSATPVGENTTSKLKANKANAATIIKAHYQFVAE